MIYTKTIIYLEKTKPNKGVLAQYKKSVIIWIRSASIRPIRGANGSIIIAPFFAISGITV